uniref:Uncharacterized protein n=1 Tax=Panagrolaimus davidi TaxID=227884 RepID=A0A914PSR1_9BILA
MYVCYKCIQAMQHTRECTKQKKSQCPLCKQFFRICHKHAKTCPAEFCKVELHGIHEKIAKKNEEACIQEFGNLNIEKPILKPPVDKKAFLQQQKIGVIRKSLAKKIISQGGLTKVDPHQARKRRAAQMIQSTTNNESSIFEKENSSATSDSPAKRLNLGKENSVANIQALLEKLSTHEKVTEEEK